MCSHLHPRSDAAYAALSQELDGLCELASLQAAKKRRLATHASTGTHPAAAAPAGAAAAAGGGEAGGSGAQGGQGGEGAAGGSPRVGGAAAGAEGVAGGSGGKGSRFKVLSVEVPHQQVRVVMRACGRCEESPRT